MPGFLFGANLLRPRTKVHFSSSAVPVLTWNAQSLARVDCRSLELGAFAMAISCLLGSE